MSFDFRDQRWLPKSVHSLRNYNFDKFMLDLLAGITVGLVALPLAMAFAIASGLTPQAGIYCAIVTALVVSLLGGSKTQIAGPTGAFVVVIAGIVAVHGVDGLFMCTVMAGVMLVVMGITGIGSAVKFIPRPIVVGFTNGIAILIASTQVKDLFGLQLEKVPGIFWLRIEALTSHFRTFSYEATILAAGTVAIHGWMSVSFEPHSGTDCCVGARHRRCCPLQTAGRNDRNTLWWYTKRPASFRDPQVSC